jgi:hypothetical protein
MTSMPPPKDKKSPEDYKQEGRDEILEWLMANNIISYSAHDDIYFRWDWRSEILLVFPWKKKS